MESWKILGFNSEEEATNHALWLREQKQKELETKAIVASARKKQKPGQPLVIDLRLLSN